jgi:CHAT domain-containing protein/Tfp pilus assembly protein PilF
VKRFQHARIEFEHGEHLRASQDADAAYREYALSNPEWAWRFRVLEAEVLFSRGLSVDSLALLDAPLPNDLAQTEIAVRKEMFEGLADSTLQRFKEADQHLSKAEQLAEAQESDALAEVTLSRGTLAFLQGDYSTARVSFRQALQRAQQKQQPFIEAKALGSLGLVSMSEERFDESIDWYSKSLEVSQSFGARAITAKTLGNMGWCYYRMGDSERALSLSTEAKEAAIQLGVDKDEMLWVRNIGAIENRQHLYSKAESDFLQSLSLARKLNNKSNEAVCLNNLAIVNLKQQRFNPAENYIREALALERANQDRPLELLSLITDGYIAIGRGDLGRAQSNFREVIFDKNSPTNLQWQAQGGLGQVYAVQNRPADAARSFQSAMKTIAAARSSIHREDFRLSFLSGAISFYEDYIHFLASNRKDEQALEVAEVSRAQTLAEGLGFTSSSSTFPVRSLNPRQTVKKLRTTVLSFWLGAEHSYVWVITPERVELVTLPPAVEIDPLVQTYRQALLGSRDVLDTQNFAGRKLYDLLVAPAAKMIPKGARVTILPDGSLYGLNFETLLAPAPELHYWIEDVDVSYANSLTLLAAGASRHAAAAKKLLLVGDPVSPDAEFPKLPQAAAEMTGIENYFPAAERTVFSGAEATPDSYLKSQPADFSNIHFVAHGTASRTSPLDSAVILSKQGDDYKLYARDIIQHPLHADLVTISACHGEGVRTYSGEGLVGLSWAFLRAGAHGVIAALWEVNDNSTPQLMDHLYSEIGKGVPPDAALRDAKLALLHSGGVYRRPFYWAPFELYRGS